MRPSGAAERAVTKAVDLILSVPLLFDLQQKYFNNYEAVREEFKDFLDTSGLDILEVGCSTGICGSKVVDMSKNRYVGIDLDPGYVEIARRRSPATTILHMDARNLAFEDRRFDRVLFVGVIHHLDDPTARDCMTDVDRVLKDDGAVLVAEPLFTPGWPVSNLLLHLDRGDHIRSRKGYEALFEGFDITRQDYFKLSFHRFCSFVLNKRGRRPT